METLIERCVDLDVHKDTVAACARAGSRRRPAAIRPHVRDDDRGTARAPRLALGHGVTVVGMESTGVYWKSETQENFFSRPSSRCLTTLRWGEAAASATSRSLCCKNQS